jgi:signal transduction histidine kinase
MPISALQPNRSKIASRDEWTKLLQPGTGWMVPPAPSVRRQTSSEAPTGVARTRIPMIAHDLKNNLQAIQSALELMEMRIAQGSSQDVDQLVKRALESIRRANGLSCRLVDAAGPESKRQCRLDVNSTITSMHPLFDSIVGPGTTVSLTLAEALGPVICDALGFENMLLNLVVNARDAMPAGGTIGIDTFRAELPGDASSLRAGGYVAIFVTDTGRGMTAEVMGRAFEPYFTTKARGKGTGLGLASVKAFVESHGGYIEAASEPGRGTSVKIFLPDAA